MVRMELKRLLTKVIFIGYILCLLFTSCERPAISPLEKVLWSAHPAMLRVLHDPKAFEIQIMYSQINRDDKGDVSFTDYIFRSDTTQYFYPASTVKLPMAVLALEFADSIKEIGLNTPYLLANDSTLHTLSDDVRQIFAVSDNDANNRLYEMLGRDQVNQRMKELGIPYFRLAHRLATDSSAKSERAQLFFIPGKDTVVLGGGKDEAIQPLQKKGLRKGNGFVRENEIVNEPMDFSEKNYFPILAQQEFMKRIFFPAFYPKDQQIRLTEATSAFLHEQMRSLPRENGYNEEDYYDSYVKFFLYGDSKDRIPPDLKIYNKVGYAYGTLTDTAYIVDEVNDVEFLLSATILVNDNGIFNDDEYEYDSIGIPFLAQLGREIYLQERSRN
jgi:Beta-lactamase enzyme family